MVKELMKKRARLQKYTWIGLPLVVIGGWFYPKLGYLLLLCMAGAVGIAFFRGRSWCDWMCPRGSFYDLFLGKISARRRIPAIFRRAGFRLFVISLLFSVLGTQVYFAWGDADKVGLAMVRLLTMTTAAGIVLGAAYHQRIWCHICPMGTISNYVSEGKQPMTVGDACVDCKVCSRVCPMQLKPFEYKEKGVMGDNDCIKCSTCVAACPKKALSFGDNQRSTA